MAVMSKEELAQKLFISRTSLAPMEDPYSPKSDAKTKKWKEWEADQAIADAAMFISRQQKDSASKP